MHVLFAHCSEREILEMDATLRVGKQHAHALRLNKNPGFSVSLPFLFSLYWFSFRTPSRVSLDAW
jgi:hypothetical protein